MGAANLDFEAFYTVLCQVEAVLNSRPLSCLSDDPNDLNPLTPSHFLIGDSMTALPEENLEKLPTNRLSHFKRLQPMTQNFWKRWHREYLHGLQQRTKWKFLNSGATLLGSVVLLIEENLPPMNWKMG